MLNSAGWKAKADDGQAKYIVKSVLCGYSEYTICLTQLTIISEYSQSALRKITGLDDRIGLKMIRQYRREIRKKSDSI